MPKRETRRASVLRPLTLLLVLILLVPVVPFLFFHESIEEWIDRLADEPPQPAIVALIVVTLLATDVVLPVPSSLVSTLAGGQLGPIAATVTSWTGLNLGAVVGHVTGRRLGRPLAEKMSSPADLEAIDHLLKQYGVAVLVMTRALPILAEASVLLAGVNGMNWRTFLPAVLLCNLGIALAYSLLGHFAAEHGWLVVAASISLALPLLVTLFLRRSLARRA